MLTSRFLDNMEFYSSIHTCYLQYLGSRVVDRASAGVY